MLARILGVLLLASPAVAFENQASKGSALVASAVSIEIRAPDGSSKKITGIPWALHLSVLEAMQQTDSIKFSADWNYQFSDWLITSIDGVINEGKDKKTGYSA